MLSMDRMVRKRYVVDLFAGCGGLSLGLENAGFTPLFVNELNTDAMESYLLNRDETNPLLRERFNAYDVKELVLKKKILRDLRKDFRSTYNVDVDCGELDLLAGGPPCQGFSGIGHRRSYSVDKTQLPSNHLYQDMAYVISQLRPKIFLFENVRGLLSARWTKDGEKGEIWKHVQETFRGIDGYDVRAQLVYAKDYGVPQNRPRVLLVGIRNDLHWKSLKMNQDHAVDAAFLPPPTGNAPDLQDVLGDLVDPSYENGGATISYPHPARNHLQKILRKEPGGTSVRRKGSPVTEHEYSRHAPHVIEKFEYMLEHNGKIPEHLKTKKFAQRKLDPRWGKEGPTITATSLPDDYVHYAQPRSLSVREWARLQLFPDCYQFAGKRTTGGLRRAGNPREGLHEREVPKYTQIGNAVPVGLAGAVGRHFRELLDMAEKDAPSSRQKELNLSE
jgi:DNA (cytosine-5)-methyltransferase 1